MKAWLQASLILPREAVGHAERLMESQGALSVTFAEVGDRPVLEPGVGETPLWETVRITGLFPGDTPAGMLAAVLSLAPGVDSPRRVALEKVHDQDWERRRQENLEPMCFGQDLWIVPRGRKAPPEAGTVLRLDPGLAFGTGTHPTTRLCLEWLDAQALAGLSVLDYGCGSGVLGIAAALEGARRVICLDNDPQALAATRANARRNSVADRLEVAEAGAENLPAVDVVVANILAGTLVDLAPRLCGALAGGGRIALSGILDTQTDEVAAAYAGRVGPLRVTGLEGWLLLTNGNGIRH